MSLPAGYTSRPMVQEDAQLIANQSATYTSALLGFPKHSPEDVANYLRDPSINLATDGWVVLTPHGTYAGSATAMPIGNTQLNIDILSDSPPILNWLLHQAEHRAHDLASAVPAGPASTAGADPLAGSDGSAHPARPGGSALVSTPPAGAAGGRRE
ncbi:hypothetical protein ACFWUU_39875, partial [Kribbella sp. NPDC058693]